MPARRRVARGAPDRRAGDRGGAGRARRAARRARDARRERRRHALLPARRRAHGRPRRARRRLRVRRGARAGAGPAAAAARHPARSRATPGRSSPGSTSSRRSSPATATAATSTGIASTSCSASAASASSRTCSSPRTAATSSRPRSRSVTASAGVHRLARAAWRPPRHRTPAARLSAKTLGVLAVVGVVVAFSLSSTLVKRAESPGVLVAFWRMVAGQRRVERRTCWSTGPAGHAARRAPGARPRRLLRPEPRGVLRRGDAQQRRQRRADRLARAVPDRAGRRLAVRASTSTRARWCSRWSRSAASRSCCSARRRTATPRCEGNVFGVLAMLLLVGLRRRRRGTSAGTWTSTTFMATICPIAAVAVLPLAIANGDVFGHERHGLDVHADPHAHERRRGPGLLVYAQKTIQIGTIGIAQVAQPALAVVWSFLLLGEVVNAPADASGIAIVVGGLLAFVVLNAASATRAAVDRDLPTDGVGPVALGDEVRGGSMRRSAARRGPAGRSPRRRRCGRARRARRPRPGRRRRARASSRIAASRSRRRDAVAASSAASRHSPSAACSPPPASRCHARRRLERRARLRASARAPAARARGGRGRARPAARRRSPRPSRSRARAWPRRSS